jgi:hypothetical protein
METKSFVIATSRLSALENKVAILNRRATKLALTPVALVKSAPRLVELSIKRGTRTPELVWVEVVDVTLSLEVPKLAGWRFVCTVQHTPEGNILCKVPGNDATDLAEYRQGPARCEHCSLPRDRKDTYVVINDAGSLRQVGKSCLADFTGAGTTPEALAQTAEWLTTAAELFETPDESNLDADDDGGTYGSSGLGLDLFLGFVVAVSDKLGFVSRKQADERLCQSTAAIALDCAEPAAGEEPIVREPSEQDIEFAKAAREFAKSIVPASDFDHNLRTIALADGVLYRNLGIAAYIVQHYRKHLTVQAEAKVAAAPSEYFGQLGERLRKVSLTYLGSASFDSQYGTTFIHRFQAEAGIAIWKTSNDGGFNVGDTFTADATVKEHTVWRDIRQTALTRVKVL